MDLLIDMGAKLSDHLSGWPFSDGGHSYDEEKSNVRMYCAASHLLVSFVLVLGQ